MLVPNAPRLKMPVEEALNMSEKTFRSLTDPDYQHETDDDDEDQDEEN
jgi:hypothetical protein